LVFVVYKRYIGTSYPYKLVEHSLKGIKLGFNLGIMYSAETIRQIPENIAVDFIYK